MKVRLILAVRTGGGLKPHRKLLVGVINRFSDFFVDMYCKKSIRERLVVVCFIALAACLPVKYMHLTAQVLHFYVHEARNSHSHGVTRRNRRFRDYNVVEQYA